MFLHMGCSEKTTICVEQGNGLDPRPSFYFDMCAAELRYLALLIPGRGPYFLRLAWHLGRVADLVSAHD